MRALPLLALLALTAIVLPVAQKAVVECRVDHSDCRRDVSLRVTYRVFGLNAMQYDQQALPEIPGDPGGAPHLYVSPMPHETGRALMSWFSVAIAASAVVTTALLDADARCTTPERRRRATVAYVGLCVSIAVFAAAVVWNSFIWRAGLVSPLMPHVGALALAASLVSGLQFIGAPDAPEGPPGLPPMSQPGSK